MRSEDHIYEYLIIGAGPAGLQLGYYLTRSGRDYLILEASDRAGSYFEKFPRHGQLISINKVHTGYDDPEANLRWDWNSLLTDEADLLFKDYTRDYFPAARHLVRYLGEYAERHGLAIRFGSRAAKVSKNGHFELVDEAGRTFKSHRLIVATGFPAGLTPLMTARMVPSLPAASIAWKTSRMA